MDRVEQVVDWSLASGLWTVLNVHHDSQWADLSDATNLDAKFAKLEKLWAQIALRFKDKSNLLVLEPLNEPVGSTREHAERYNDMNQRFVNIVRASGGLNKGRLLTLPGLRANIQYTVDWFVSFPCWSVDGRQKLMGTLTGLKCQKTLNRGSCMSTITTHSKPCKPGRGVCGLRIVPVTLFPTAGAAPTGGRMRTRRRSKTRSSACGSASMRRPWWASGGLRASLSMSSAAPPGSTLISLSAPQRSEPIHARSKLNWRLTFRQKYNLASQLWDNGLSHFDRASLKWRDPVKRNVIVNAARGVPNSLPATGQPATLYQKSRATVASQTIALSLNGNTVSKVSNARGKTLQQGTDYTVGATSVTVSASYLRSVLQGSTLGVRDTLTIQFNRGASLPFDVRMYDKPTVARTAITVLDLSQRMAIAINPKGSTLAAVKAVKQDGSFLRDDWTKGLGPLQEGRLCCGDCEAKTDGTGVTLSPSLLQAIKAAPGGVAILTFEHWPRTDPSNYVTVRVTA